MAEKYLMRWRIDEELGNVEHLEAISTDNDVTAMKHGRALIAQRNSRIPHEHARITSLKRTTDDQVEAAVEAAALSRTEGGLLATERFTQPGRIWHEPVTPSPDGDGADASGIGDISEAFR